MPRSIGGRLFGVVWINVGLVILAIYMGIVTSSLSSNSLEQVNNIYGMPVSILATVQSANRTVSFSVFMHLFPGEPFHRDG